MTEEADLAVIRRAYAKQIMAAAGATPPRLEAAFAAVRREDHLGPGPWQMLRWPHADYRPTPSADPVYLYTDDIVAILPERHLNNGQPSLHAALIASVLPSPGEHIVHICAGVGYYSAILAHLVGPGGQVTAVELDPGLADRAAASLAPLPQVRVICGDGAAVAFDAADLVYVNAGATRPADSWLDGLAEGGRLILPLTTDRNFGTGAAMSLTGAVFRIERRGGAFLARRLLPVAIFPAAGARDAASEAALAAALARGGAERVTRLYRDENVPDERCWLRAPGWCLGWDG